MSLPPYAGQSAKQAEISKGDLVRCKPEDVYSGSAGRHVLKDGYVYGKLFRTNIDSDGDVKVKIIDGEGNKAGSSYFNFAAMEILDEMSHHTNQVSPDDELEERLESKSEEDSLAVLQEEEENLVQMQEIRARTIKPGVLELPVSTVTSASNSQNWAVKVEHPVVGELTSYFEKPLAGWSDDYPIVDLLSEYDIYDGNPYKLQRREVLMRLEGDDPEVSSDWQLVLPSEVHGEEEQQYPESLFKLLMSRINNAARAFWS